MAVNETTDAKHGSLAEHDEEAKMKIALAAGAKGHGKSADVAMKLFENHDIDVVVDPADQQKVVRKVDWFIIPMIAVNYVGFNS